MEPESPVWRILADLFRVKDLQEGLGIPGNELQCVDDPPFSRMAFFYSLFCGGPSFVNSRGLDVDTNPVGVYGCSHIIDISDGGHKISPIGADDFALIARNCKEASSPLDAV